MDSGRQPTVIREGRFRRKRKESHEASAGRTGAARPDHRKAGGKGGGRILPDHNRPKKRELLARHPGPGLASPGDENRPGKKVGQASGKGPGTGPGAIPEPSTVFSRPAPRN